MIELMLAEDERLKALKQQGEAGAAGKFRVEAAGACAWRTRENAAQRTDAAEPKGQTEGSRERDSNAVDETLMNLDSGITANGILEVMPDGYGFIRCENYLPRGARRLCFPVSDTQV